LNLANLLLVLFLFNTYLQKAQVNAIVVLLIVYSVVSLYWLGFHLIKESADE